MVSQSRRLNGSNLQRLKSNTLHCIVIKVKVEKMVFLMSLKYFRSTSNAPVLTTRKTREVVSSLAA